VWNLSNVRPLPRRPDSRAPTQTSWSEAELADVWEQRRYAAQWLVDCCGRHLRVVFPGRRWGGPGPDFVGAVLAERDGTLVRGDVEVHVRASSWAGHHHAQDPAYRQVVLHVVHKDDVMALDARGWHVPTVKLEPLRGPPRPERAPCVRSTPAVLEIVREAGRERFRARAARFEGDLATVEADQVVWRGVCEALGFRRNTLPFGRLADAVPWSQAAPVVIDRGPVGLAGALLGAAGLIAEASLPEAHAWRALQRQLRLRPVLQAASWDRRQMRGANAPAWRCRGLAELAARWTGAPGSLGEAGCSGRLGEAGCSDRLGEGGCSGRLGEGGPAEQVLAAVRQAAGRRHPKLWVLARASPWIGRGRAQVVVINVLLPFAAAAGVQEAAELFERLPGEPTNRVVRYMAAQLGGPDSRVRFRGACLQQGLLQLFKLTCASRVCERCPAHAAHRRGATTEGFDTSNG
jgi:hypothetical protein